MSQYGMVVRRSKATGDSTRYEWDIENRLVRVVKQGIEAEYVYDALGRRVAKTVNGVRTEFRYDGEDLILTMDDGGTVTGSWTFGPGIDQPLAMSRGGVMHYYLADGLGSVRALANSTGTVAQTYEYSVFGQITEQTGSVENPFTYTAREWEPEVGLYYYRARWYDARVGRFLSEDPLGIVGSVQNPYSYTVNCPVAFVDPYGQDLATILVSALALVLGIPDPASLALKPLLDKLGVGPQELAPGTLADQAFTLDENPRAVLEELRDLLQKELDILGEICAIQAAIKGATM